MRIDSNSKSTLEKMKLISGEPQEKIRLFFESLCILSVLDYLDDKETPIPFMGDLKLEKVDDNTLNFTMSISPNQMLSRNIAQILQGEESEIERLYKKKIRMALEEIVKG